MSKLILIRGVPGSGKSTFAKHSFPGVLNLEQDMFFMKDGEYKFDSSKILDAVLWCETATRNALSCGMDVVVSNTSTKKAFVEKYNSIADEFGASFKVYCMHGSFNDVHNVPNEVKSKMENGFESWLGEVHVYPENKPGQYMFMNASIDQMTSAWM